MDATTAGPAASLFPLFPRRMGMADDPFTRSLQPDHTHRMT